MSTRVATGVWHLADPKITLASASSMLIGAALAAGDGPIAGGWLLLTVRGILCLEAAKYASGEIFDWDSGVDLAVDEGDRSPFSGGKRVIVDGLLTRRQTKWTAMVFYGLGGAAGLAIAAWQEPWVLPLGVAGAALAYFYHAPPLALSYRGLGELAVALVYGPLIAIGTYLVQRHGVPPSVMAATVPLGLLVGAFLWINEFPDRRADEASGKRTLVVRLGARRAAAAFGLLVLAAFAFLALLPPRTWFGFAGLPLAVAAARRLRAAPSDTRAIVPAQKWTLLSFVALAIGMAAGILGLR